MHRKLFSVLFMFFAAVTVLSAQEDDDWMWNKQISKIEFEGLDNVRKSELNGIISSFIDIEFSEDVFNDILDRLYALDLFEDINPYALHDSKDENKVHLVFQVQERPLIRAITFSGNKKIRNGELREKIKIKTSDVYVEGKVLLDERTIRNYYLEKGYTSIEVTHTSEVKSDGVHINFDIKEGANTVISEINFSGNSIVSTHTLKSKMKLKEVGLLKDGAYQNSLLEQDKLLIIQYYNERGYIDAFIEDVNIITNHNESKQRDELTINFIIQEGSQYIYNGMTITGNKVFSTDTLLKLNKLKAGTVYNQTKFQETISAIYGLYNENGYMFNEYYPMPVKDTDRHEISYNLVIEERNRSHIENIIIKGNTKTKDYVIRREIPIQPGDTYSREKVISGFRNLMNTQFFSNAVPEQVQGSEQNLVDLIWNVEEQSTSTLQFGLTFSGATDPDEIPISGHLRVGNTNLFGEGKSISAGLTISSTEQSMEFSYGQNWIGNLPIAFESSLSISHSNGAAFNNMWLPDLSLDQEHYYFSYEGLGVTLGTGLSRRWYFDYAILKLAGGLNNSLTRYFYDQSIFIPFDQGLSSYADRWGLLNSIWTSVSVDNRDIAHDPTKGWFASDRLGWYGLIPGVEKEFFVRNDLKLEGYFTLAKIKIAETDYKLVLADYTGISSIFPVANSTVSDMNRVYIDGVFNARGWNEAYKASRGLGMFSNRLELRFPIVPNMLGFDFFWDGAYIKNKATEIVKISMDDFYFSFGPAVRFLMPQFPLHLMFTFRYKIIENEFTWAETPFQFILSFNMTNR